MQKKIYLFSLSLCLLISCKPNHDSVVAPVVPPSTPPPVISPPSVIPLGGPSIEWQKDLGGSEDDFPFSIASTADGSSVIAGNTRSRSSGDVPATKGNPDSWFIDAWVVKLSIDGNKLWSKNYGGSGTDAATSIRATRDGGFIIAGFTNSTDGDLANIQAHGNNDAWIVKLDADGNIAWQKSLGGSGGDNVSGIIEISDGGFVFVGQTNSTDGDLDGIQTHGNDDAWIVKLDANGGMVWQKKIGGSSSDLCTSIVPSSDNGFLVAAYTHSTDGNITGSHNVNGGIYGDYWIVKLDSNGNLVWQKALGGSQDEYPNSILESSDGNVYVGGHTTSNDGDVTGINSTGIYGWLVKLSSNGTMIWQKPMGGPNSEITSLIETPDKNIVMSGLKGDGSSDPSDVWIVQVTGEGNLTWQKLLGGSMYDAGRSISLTSDGSLIVSSVSVSHDREVAENHGGTDYWVVKLH